MALQVSSPGPLDDDARREVVDLAERVHDEVGEPPLSDQALTRLSAPNVRHALARRGTDLVGYAQLDGTSLEIAGDAVAVDALLAEFEPLPSGTQIWSHGVRSPVGHALEQRGYTATRRLHQLRRRLQPLPQPEPLPDGVRIRTFVPGADDEAWLSVNAAAFAALPDQGGWTIDDLRARQSEPWFDPAGFFLAERGSDLLGFHWTKVHTPQLGEVYVLGISPAAQGIRLGSILLERGLEYLAARGCVDVLLYVDDANTGAMNLYERAGFARYDDDVLWGR